MGYTERLTSSADPANSKLTESGPETFGPERHAGAVVIGKNEGERLGRALRATVSRFAVVIYVDSNSSDGSRELAESLGAEVLHLAQAPFTPSRGRQTGFEELLRTHPELRYVQFVDGDCVLGDEWPKTAFEYLEKHADVAAVFG